MLIQFAMPSPNAEESRTIAEAREMAEDAIRCHLRALMKDGEEIPKDPFAPQQPISEELRVTV